MHGANQLAFNPLVVGNVGNGIGLLLSPLLALVALAVRLKLGSPVLFRQQRPGLRGKPFTLVKFRTMLDARDSNGRPLPDAERLPPFGRWLRATSLDELPELWNVLKGEMSLVGPRPIVESEVGRYSDRFDLYTQVLPGITGLWQVSGRNETSYQERVSLDTYYVRNWSLWLDLYLLARTVWAVMWGKGAY